MHFTEIHWWGTLLRLAIVGCLEILGCPGKLGSMDIYIYNLLIGGIYWVYNPLILIDDPNFLGHPSSATYSPQLVVSLLVMNPIWDQIESVKKKLHRKKQTKTHYPKDPLTLQWRGWNLYSRGVFGFSK